MRTILIMAALATVAVAGIVEYGPQVGYWMPTGDVGDVYDGNLYLGGQALFHLPLIAVEGSIGYVSLKTDSEILDVSGHIIPVGVGIRSYMGPLYAAGGLEVDMLTVEVGGDEESDSEFGGYFGVGIVPAIPFAADIDASARLHFVDFEDMWVGITVGLNF